jgi:hypothetical protein
MPSNYEKVQSITRIAGEDLTAGQYRFLKVNAAGKVVKSGNGERASFVSIGKADVDQALECGIGGRLLVVAGAAIAAGAAVQSDANGAAVTQNSTGDVCGEALEAATAAGELISIIFAPQGAP